MSLKYLLPGLICLVCFGSCVPSKYGSHTKGEMTMIHIHKGEAIDHGLLTIQEKYREGEYIAARGMNAFFDPTVYTSSAVGIVATGIKNVIANEQRKYQAQYQFKIEPIHWHRLKDDSMYFYKDVSTNGCFDPEGMQFTGFTVTRLCHGGDTAMKAVFELDNANLCEIYHDGIFRLKLKQLVMNYAKAKVPARGKKKVNLDIQIQFLASYITSTGQINSNMVLGNFTLIIPGVDLTDPSSCAKFAGTPLNGLSFIVPRSYGFKKVGNNLAPVYSQGAYSINVTVKEITKTKYVNKLLADETNTVIDVTQKGVLFKMTTPATGTGGSTGTKKTGKN